MSWKSEYDCLYGEGDSLEDKINFADKIKQLKEERDDFKQKYEFQKRLLDWLLKEDPLAIARAMTVLDEEKDA